MPLLVVAAVATQSRADSVKLKNGLILDGKPVPVQGLMRQAPSASSSPTMHYPVLMVHTGIKRYFVPARQVAEINREALIAYEEFKLPPHLRQRRQLTFQSLGALLEATEFDKHGRRRITVSVGGKPTHVFQGVTTINPKYLTIEATNYIWEHGVSTSAVPVEQLDAMLREATDQKDPNLRMSIAVFYMQAAQYLKAAEELDAIQREFPELQETADEVTQQLRQLQARRLLADLRDRQRAGQHELAYLAARTFPTEQMSAAVLKDVRTLMDDIQRRRSDRGRAVMLLAELEAGLHDPQQAAAVPSMRSVIRDELDLESLPRLDAFLKLSGDETLDAAQKLAYAYSGWVLGSADAVGDLDLAIRLWQARFLIREYLREDDPLARSQNLARLADLEGLGPDRVARMIPYLPPLIDTPGVKPGVAATITVDGAGADQPVSYGVLLPQEYTPHHRYPLIVALNPAGRPADDELVWWGGTAEAPGQAQRHGYIVIAPAYADPKAVEYDYAAAGHYVVLTSIRDARKRFNVDSDRVFLSGHGMGGDAAFDIGMSHPDVFAGVIPITGLCGGYSKWYWQNADHLPFYIVTGELARSSLSDPDHARILNRMMLRGSQYDMVYAEYIGRGYEHYYEEIHALFDWMGRLTRVKYPKEVEASVLRPIDDRFYWVRLAGLPKQVLDAAPLAPGGAGTRPMPLSVRIADGADDRTVIHISSGAERHTLSLSPELIDFDKRLMIRSRGRQEFNDFIEGNVQALLDDLRIRGDRQKLVWAEIEVE